MNLTARIETVDITTAQAAALIRYYRAMDAAVRPIDRRATTAALDAACDLVYAGGNGSTPTHVRLITMDTIAAAGPRPLVNRTGSNDAVRAWDADLARTLAAALRAA